MRRSARPCGDRTEPELALQRGREGTICNDKDLPFGAIRTNLTVGGIVIRHSGPVSSTG